MQRSMDAARGCLLGLACGDALGRPVEFSTPAGIERRYGTLDTMVGDGTHGQPAGTITDDTELALGIARSLAEHSEFDGADVAERFVDWYQGGPFDIGLMTADALREIDQGTHWREAGQVVWESRSEGSNAGNGSLMRCAPYAIRYARSPIELDAVSRRSSAITHADRRCTTACSVLNRVIAALVLLDEEAARELPFDPLLGAVENPLFGLPADLESALEPGLEGLSHDKLDNSGYVVTTLQAGLYYGLTAESAEDAIVTAVNAGGDSDTIGAVAGAVAGARFGATSLPERWLGELDRVGELDRLAKELHGQREDSVASDEGSPTADRDVPASTSYLSRRDEPPVPEDVDVPRMTGGHRPREEPKYLPDEPPTDLSAGDVVWFDWMARQHLSAEYGYPIHPRPEVDENRLQEVEFALGDALRVRLPEYATATTLDDLPEQDRERLEELLDAGTDALETAADTILEVRSAGGKGYTHVHGFLAASSRNAPFRCDDVVEGATVEAPPVEALLETARAFTQLAATYLDVFAMLDESHDEVEELRDKARSAHESATRGIHYVTSFAVRHPEIEDVE